MALLCSKFQIFSFTPSPPITTAPPINWTLGNPNYFKLLQSHFFQLVIPACNAEPPLV